MKQFVFKNNSEFKILYVYLTCVDILRRFKN